MTGLRHIASDSETLSWFAGLREKYLDGRDLAELYPWRGATICTADDCDGTVTWRDLGEDFDHDELGTCDKCGYGLARKPQKADMTEARIASARKAGIPRQYAEYFASFGFTHPKRSEIEHCPPVAAITGGTVEERHKLAAWRLWLNVERGWGGAWVHAEAPGRSYKADEMARYLRPSLLVVHSIRRAVLDREGRLRSPLLSIVRQRWEEKRWTVLSSGLPAEELKAAIGADELDIYRDGFVAIGDRGGDE